VARVPRPRGLAFALAVVVALLLLLLLGFLLSPGRNEEICFSVEQGFSPAFSARIEWGLKPQSKQDVPSNHTPITLGMFFS